MLSHEPTDAPSDRAPQSPALERRLLLGLSADEMRRDGLLATIPAYRARQISHWLYARGETSFEQMTNLPAALRRDLASEYSLEPDPIETLASGADDEAFKFLFRLGDGRLVESVLINTPRRRTICVSSQAGCAYGCTFCATARMGPGRNLLPREIVSQIVAVRKHMRTLGLPETHNVVFMGMGEPLANLEHLIASLRRLESQDGLGIGRRRITVSTVGLEPQIRALAESDVRPRLAFSLNATTDAVRTELMPINKKYPFREVFLALRNYRERTRMRVSLEYVLLDAVNDSPEDAARLVGFATEHDFKVNLIVYNAHPAAPYQPPSAARIASFVQAMAPVGPSVSIRYSKGRDILAACGQLSTLWRDQPDTEPSKGLPA